MKKELPSTSKTPALGLRHCLWWWQWQWRMLWNNLHMDNGCMDASSWIHMDQVIFDNEQNDTSLDPCAPCIAVPSNEQDHIRPALFTCGRWKCCCCCCRRCCCYGTCCCGIIGCKGFSSDITKRCKCKLNNFHHALTISWNSISLPTFSRNLCFL